MLHIRIKSINNPTLEKSTYKIRQSQNIDLLFNTVKINNIEVANKLINEIDGGTYKGGQVYIDRFGTTLPLEDLKRVQTIGRLLGYEDFDNYDEVGVYTRGYRILSKIPRMPSNIVDNLVKSFKSFQHILAADIPALDDVEGIGEVRAKTIKQSLKRMQEQFVFDNLIL